MNKLKTVGDPHNKLPIGTLDGLDAFGFPDLDPGIRHYVCILRSQGIETCQSCEGGDGHSFDEPTVEFWGGQGEGLRAVAAAMAYGLPVRCLHRTWNVANGEISGPIWTMTFACKADEHERLVAGHEARVLAKMGKVRPKADAIGS